MYLPEEYIPCMLGIPKRIDGKRINWTSHGDPANKVNLVKHGRPINEASSPGKQQFHRPGGRYESRFGIENTYLHHRSSSSTSICMVCIQNLQTNLQTTDEGTYIRVRYKFKMGLNLCVQVKKYRSKKRGET